MPIGRVVGSALEVDLQVQGMLPRGRVVERVEPGLGPAFQPRDGKFRVEPARVMLRPFVQSVERPLSLVESLVEQLRPFSAYRARGSAAARVPAVLKGKARQRDLRGDGIRVALPPLRELLLPDLPQVVGEAIRASAHDSPRGAAVYSGEQGLAVAYRRGLLAGFVRVALEVGVGALHQDRQVLVRYALKGALLVGLREG